MVFYIGGSLINCGDTEVDSGKLSSINLKAMK